MKKLLLLAMAVVLVGCGGGSKVVRAAGKTVKKGPKMASKGDDLTVKGFVKDRAKDVAQEVVMESIKEEIRLKDSEQEIIEEFIKGDLKKMEIVGSYSLSVGENPLLSDVLIHRYHSNGIVEYFKNGRKVLERKWKLQICRLNGYIVWTHPVNKYDDTKTAVYKRDDSGNLVYYANNYSGMSLPISIENQRTFVKVPAR